MEIKFKFILEYEGLFVFVVCEMVKLCCILCKNKENEVCK